MTSSPWEEKFVAVEEADKQMECLLVRTLSIRKYSLILLTQVVEEEVSLLMEEEEEEVHILTFY